MKRILIVFLVCILASGLELHAQSDSIVSASGEIGGRNGWRGELTVDSYTVWEEDETYFIRLNQFSNLQPGYTLDKVKFYWDPFENNFSPEFDVVVWTGGNANWIVQESNVADLANAVYYTNDSSNFGIQVYSQHYTADVGGIQEVVLTTPYTVTGEEGEIWVGIHCCGYTCGGLADEHCDVNTTWGNFLDYYYSTSESHPGWNLHVPLYYSDDTHSQCKSSPFTLSVWVNVGGVDEVINDWAISLQDPVDNEDFPADLTADDYIVVDESLDSIYVRFSLYNMGYDTATSDVLIDIYMVDNNGENVYYWEQKSMGVNAENPCRVEYGFGRRTIAVIGIDQFQEYNLSYPLQVCVSATPADLTVDPDMSNNIACVTYVAEHYFPNSVISPSGEIGVMNNGLEFIGETGIVSQFPRLTDAGELLYYAPIVTTDSASILSGDSLSATAYGTILFNGWNEEIDERGFQISTAFDFSFDVQTYIVDSASLYIDCDSPCTENEFSFTFSELTAGTTYYVRAYATNASGIRYGEARRFTTAGIGYPIDGLPCPGTPILTDIDGNTYNTVQIGAQCWMRENLKTTMYADGTPISYGGNDISTTIAHWYFPNESSYNKATYGLLYNWKAVMRDTTTISCTPSGVQGICPTGWHVPSDAEWRWMEMEVGMSQSNANNTRYRGNIAAKLCGNTGWNSSSAANAAGNLNAPDRNSSGFSALPAGGYYSSYYYNFGNDATFWSATEYGNSTNARYRALSCVNAGVYRDYANKTNGFSVRCVRDEEEGSSVTLPTSGSYSITTCDEWIYDCGGASADYSNNSDGFITIYPGGSARVVIDQGTYNVENNYDKIYVYDGEGTNEPLLATLTGSDSISTPIGSTVGPLTIRFVSDVTVTNDGFALHVSCTNTPGVNTAVVSNITETTAICGGNVTADGGANVTARGVCWSTSQNPTVSDSHTTDGSGTGSFTSSITGLTANTTYYVRAYATNSAGTSYGAQRSFTTILFDSVAGVFIPDGPYCATQCIDLPFVVSSFPSGSAFSRNTDLMSVGLNIEHSYIGDINISIICPNGRSARLLQEHNGINNDKYFGLAEDYNDNGCYAQNNPQGVGWNYCWSENSTYAQLSGYCYNYNNVGNDAYNSVDSSHVAHGYPGQPGFVQGRQYYQPYQSFSNLIGCPLNGLWQIEICDTWGMDNGYVFGWSLIFDSTLLWRETVAIVATSQAKDITYTSASIGGEVVSDGGANVTARGVCWSTSQNPTISDNHTTDGNGTGSFTSSITGLSANTTYYVRAYATNSVGTAYGEQRSFTTSGTRPCPGVPTLTDVDGNTYNTVQIGNQCWMKENLRTTKKPNGDSISSGIWAPGSNSVTTYGRLYSWATVMNGATSSNANPSNVQGICPSGWHVPSDNEWKQMEMEVGMSQSDADGFGWRGYIAAKLCGNTGWTSSSYVNAAGYLNASGRNSSGFSALPAGGYYGSSYRDFGNNANFWSATEFSSDLAYGRDLFYDDVGVTRPSAAKSYGFSVRCVRDAGIGGGDEPTPCAPTSSTHNIVISLSDLPYTFGTDTTFLAGTTAGTYTLHRTNAGGCDSTITINLTVNAIPTDITDTIAFVPNGGIGAPDTTLVERGEEVTVPTNTYTHDGNWQFAGWNTEANGSGTPYAANATFTANGNITLFAQWNTWCDGTPQANELGTSRIDSVKDHEDNWYKVVQIGNQCWMKENLRTTHYADSTSISQGSTSSTTTAYWYYPNSIPSYQSTYGLLYNWKAVMRNSSSSSSNPSGVQGICPDGWHVPSDNEWKQMEMAVGMSQSDADGTGWRGNIAAKLCDNTGWNSSTNANAAGNLNAPDRNSSGFSALPAGGYYGSYSYFYGAYFWSATEYSSDNAYNRRMYYSNAGVNRGNYNKTNGFSVRCVRDAGDSTTATLPIVTTSAVSNITEATATCGGNVTADGGATVTARGVCWSTSQNPTISDNHTTDGNGTGSFTSSITGLSANTTYYVRAYATNSVGTAYGEIRSFTIADPCNPYLVGRVASTSSAIDGSDLAETIVEYNTNTDTASLFEFFVRKNNCADCGIKISLEVDMYVVDENSNESLMSNVTDYADLSFASYLDLNYTQWTPADASSISIPGHYVSFNGISQRANYFNLSYADPDYSCNPVSLVTPASIAALPYYGPDYAGVGTPNLGRVHGIKVSSWRQAGTYKFVIRLVRRDDATAYALTTRDWCLENQLGGHSATLTSLVYDTLTFWVYVDTATNDGQPCPGTPTLTDVDGNTYNTVQIGEQCWMKENLRTTKYADSTTIALGSDASTTIAYRYYPSNNNSNVATYGYLYNWTAVMHNASSSSSNPSGVQGICPTGWHVPSYAEWTQLTDYVSSQSTYCCSGNTAHIAKSLAGTTGWASSTATCAVGNTPSNNNATGFSALPAGYYDSSYRSFGIDAYFWSATEIGCTAAYGCFLNYKYAWVYRNGCTESYGCSVRCVRDESVAPDSAARPTVTTNSVSNITETTATCGGNVTTDGGANITARGVCWSTSQNPTINGNHTTDGSGTGSFTSNIAGLSEGTTYYVRAYATNSVGTAYGEQRSFTTAVDPCNPYLVGRVASTSSAIDGSDLTETIVEHTTSTDTTSQFEFFVRKNCTDCDTKISLEVDLYVLEENGNESLMGNVNDYANLSFASYLDNNYTQWTPADASSISIPGHYVSFNGISQRANYFNLCYADPDYSCNPVSRVTPASIAALPYYGPDYAGVGTPNLGRVHGIKVSSWRQAGTYKFVIRLVRRDDATAYALTNRDWCLENQLGGHGAALTSLVYDTLTFWVFVDTATNDGQPCPSTPTLTDVDGNTYNTVLIGSQCWMKENLKTTKYADGTPIENGSATSYDVAYWYYPNNVEANKATYGLLYNWKATMRDAASTTANPSNVQGICPTGWHVPSGAEWLQLTNYVSSQSQYCCSGNTSNIAKALASTTGWHSSSTTCAVGNTPSSNNATGFSALPVGYYGGSYYNFGIYAIFWSATQATSTDAYYRFLFSDNAIVARNYCYGKCYGYSVRCVRD